MSRYIDAEPLKKEEIILYDYFGHGHRVATMDIVYKQPTINIEDLYGGRRVLLLDDVYRVIAGHSDYHGDNILSALTCIAEGKEVKPVKPLEYLGPKGKWIGLEYDGYADGNHVYDLWECSNCGNEEKGEDVPEQNPFCRCCGAKMEA